MKKLFLQGLLYSLILSFLVIGYTHKMYYLSVIAGVFVPLITKPNFDDFEDRLTCGFGIMFGIFLSTFLISLI